MQDALLEKRAWGERYIVNAFPYLTNDITSVNEQDLAAMKKCFKFHYQKYESFKKAHENIQIPTYQDRQILQMQNAGQRELKELQSKEMRERLQDMLKSEAEDLFNLKLDNWNNTKGKRTNTNAILTNPN